MIVPVMVIVVIVVIVMVVVIIVVIVIVMVVVVVVVVLIIFGDRQRMCHMLCMNLHVSSVCLLVCKHDCFVGALCHVLTQVFDQYRPVVQ